MAEERVRAEYERLAPVYDRRWQTYLTRTLSFLHVWVSLTPEATVLDAGCGTGLFIQRVVQHQPQQRIAGIDLSRGMLAIGQRRCSAFPNVTFQAASMTALPFAAQSFDVVVSASALHYVADPRAALREMRRVVKPDGSVTILDWCRDDLACMILDWLLRWIDPAHQRAYTQAELHRLLREAGFTVVRARRKRFGLVWGLMVVTATPVILQPLAVMQ